MSSSSCPAGKKKKKHKSTLYRLFTVPYFSVTSSRSRALRFGLPSWMNVKSTQGAGDGLGGGKKNIFFFRLPLPNAINADARPLVTRWSPVSVSSRFLLSYKNKGTVNS